MKALAVLEPSRLVRLFGADVQNVVRDPMLSFAMALSILPIGALSLFRDPLDRMVADATDIEDVSRYAAAVALVLPAYLLGWITGFLLLEDRDDGALLAVEMTPIGKTGLLVYRMCVTALLSLALSIVGVNSIVAPTNLASAVTLVVVVPVEACLTAIALVALARNKVEGLALTKIISLLSVGPLLVLIPTPWRYASSVVPTYWVGELVALKPSLPLPIAIAGAVLVHLVVGAVALLLFRRRG